MTHEIINLAEHRRQRNARRGPMMINPVWPLIILGCLTLWIWFMLAAVNLIPPFGAYLESLFL